MAGIHCGRISIDNIIDPITTVENDRRYSQISTSLFLDVKDLFDRVTHRAILNALSDIVIVERLYEWKREYLEGRSIFVRTSDSKSP